MFPNLQSALPKTGQVGGNPILLILHHRTLGRKEEPERWTLRRPDYEIRYEMLTARLRATLAATTVEPYEDLLQEIKPAHAIDALAADVKHKIVGTPIIYISDLQ
jgi:phosphoserine phosphatase